MTSDSALPVLVVDPEPRIVALFRAALRDDGFAVEAAPDAEQAEKALDAPVETPTLVFLSLRDLSDAGLDWMRRVRENGAAHCFIPMGDERDALLAAQALRAGARDYLVKPLRLEDVRECAARHAGAFAQGGPAAGAAPSTRRSAGISKRRPRGVLIGRGARMRALNELIATVAPSDSTVLIRGESGTGKELVARLLHDLSPRRVRPMVPVNCGAIPEELLESELFGHVKGSFTGAIASRAGRFVMADGGTVFLDEVGDMSPKLQVKVLRVLQEQELEPVGSTETVHVDVRVLAATNVDLERAVEEGRFREDLYYRLNVIPLDVPPLRERVEDLPLLIDHFVKRFNRVQPRKLKGFAPRTVDMLRKRPWAGNVRELENLVERMTVLARGDVVQPEDLPPMFRTPRPRPGLHAAASASEAPAPSGPVGGEPTPAALFGAATPVEPPCEHGLEVEERLSIASGSPISAAEDAWREELENGVALNDLVDRFERRLILEALEECGGVKSRTAEKLGIKRTTLVEKMKKKEIVYEG